ncbi:TetR/AcrR family transcriptional regulator [Spongiactinospora sp. TRM90649]|uniref:TetR/AcrR family transcriptional regulator n=1 Tax=Spongiactinospora sp. TRM90649 TaxID=3031114 RepID=UPI0023F678F9|nr:TetR/AcrR family transcriptional regulator [Spongiactinospora sp. TRM90649]MDF5753623.1 TetR/AcrR family transcriptional regulator [Spongiactinospora sp. TRM90649]
MPGNAIRADRRVRRTRQAVQRALIELILDKGYDAVTVTDIINRADVGRSTFYAHFADKQDVLFSNLDELAETLRSSAKAHGDDGLFGFSLPMLEHVAEQRSLMRAVLGRRGGAAIIARAERFIGEIVRDDIIAALPPGAPPPPALDLVVTGVVGAFVAMLSRWADGDPSAGPEEVDAVFRGLIGPGVREVLDLPR